MAGPGGIPDADWKLAQEFGQANGVDPMLLVAIGIHETQWGKAGLGRQGLILGVGAYDSGPTFQWRGVRAQLKKGAELLASHGVRTVQDVLAGKARWWATDPSWATQVGAVYKDVSGGKSFVSPSDFNIPNPLNPGDWFSGIAGLFGALNLKDMFERLGLILLGAVLVLVGLRILGMPAMDKVTEIAAGGGGGDKSGGKADVAADLASGGGGGSGSGSAKRGGGSQGGRRVATGSPARGGAAGGAAKGGAAKGAAGKAGVAGAVITIAAQAKQSKDESKGK